MSILTSLNIDMELEAVEKEYHLEKKIIISALQYSLSQQCGRDVFLTQDDNGKFKVLRINKNGSLSEVGYKVFKKGKKAFRDLLLHYSKEKEKERISTMFKPREVVNGVILDITTNGYFVEVKGIRAFFPKKNSYQTEKLKGMYEINNKISFQIDKVISNRVYLTRKSLALTKLVIQNITGLNINLRQTQKGILAFCPKPYLDEFQMSMIKTNIPQEVIFKKQKERH